MSSWPEGTSVFERVLITMYPEETMLITDGLDMFFEPVTVLHSNLIQGVPGPQGPVGPQGALGPTGPTGPIGLTGVVIDTSAPVDQDVLWVDTVTPAPIAIGDVEKGAPGGVASLDPVGMIQELPLFGVVSNPRLAQVYEPCYRNGATGAFTAFATGQNWRAEPGSTGITVGAASFLADGGIQFTVSASTSGDAVLMPAWVVDGFSEQRPGIEVCLSLVAIGHWPRLVFVKYINRDNFLAIGNSSSLGWKVVLRVAGVDSILASFESSTAGDSGHHTGDLWWVRAELGYVHGNTSEAGIALLVQAANAREKVLVPLTNAQWDPISADGTVGLAYATTTQMHHFRAWKHGAPLA